MTRKICYLMMVAIIICHGCSGQNEGRDARSGAKKHTNTVNETEKVIEIENQSTANFTKVNEANTTTPTVNVYVENSGSMYGYVKGVTDFEAMVYDYLLNIKLSKIIDSLNLYYINSVMISRGTVTKEDNAILDDFIRRLEPNSFKAAGGNMASSDIAEIFKNIIDKTDDNTISILVTDGIFSPGTAQNADDYLNNQQIGIKHSVSNLIENVGNAAAIMYQSISHFDGDYYYYNKLQHREVGIHYNGNRPYYIWLFGSADNLTKLRKAIPENKFNGQGIKNTFLICEGNRAVNYAIDAATGNFDRHKLADDKHSIHRLSKDNSGKIKFAVKVDFSELLLSDEYLLDTQNYIINNDYYEMAVKKIETEGSSFTHKLTFTSKDGRPHTSESNVENFSVKLKMSTPSWVGEIHDTDGSIPDRGKTYGIKYQIDGCYGAFTRSFELNNEYYTEIKINIK